MGNSPFGDFFAPLILRCNRETLLRVIEQLFEQIFTHKQMPSHSLSETEFWHLIQKQNVCKSSQKDWHHHLFGPPMTPNKAFALERCRSASDCKKKGGTQELAKMAGLFLL